MKLPLTTSKRLAIAAAIAASVSLFAYADPMSGGGPGCGGMGQHIGHRMGSGMGPGMGDHLPHFLRGVTLTEAQRDRMFAIVHGRAPELRDQAKAVHKSQDDLRALALSGQYDDTKAKALVDAGAKAAAEMQLTMARTDHQLFALLTPEQQKQAAEAKDRLEQQPMHRGGRGPEQRR